MKKLLQFAAAAMAFVPMLSVAHGPTRQSVEESIVINAPVEEVWEMIKDFDGMDKWHPAVDKVEMKDDNIRVLTLNTDGNPTITEELDKADDDKRVLIYSIEEMSVVKTTEFNSDEVPYYTLPVSNYKSWIFVSEVDEGTEVKWRGKFYRSFMNNPPVPEGLSDKDAVKAVTDVYTAGLKNLKNIMEK